MADPRQTVASSLDPGDRSPPPALWHAAPGGEVLARLSSRPDGLTTAEAEQRLAEHGPNALTRQQGPSAWQVLLRQFTSPLIYALLVSAVVAFALGDIPDGAVVLGVVVLNALIGFVQEYRAGKAIQALAQLVSEPATVRRDGRWTRAGAGGPRARRRRVARGRSPGRGRPADPAGPRAARGRVGADRRVGAGGQGSPSRSTPAAELADRRSLLHGGTLVTAGSAEAVVVATGDRTELGRISGLLGSVEHDADPADPQIARLGSTVTKVIGVVAVVLLGVALLRGYPLADAALAAITLAVAAIPEGLPAIVTIALAIGVQRMARRRAVVRELPAVETLGSTSVVCTDKTGTLTRNEMVLRRAWTPRGDEAEFEGVGYAAAGRVVTADGAGDAAWTGRCGGCWSAARAGQRGAARRRRRRPERAGRPDRRRAARRRRAGRCRPRRAVPPTTRPRAVLPFDSARQYMASAPASDGRRRAGHVPQGRTGGPARARRPGRSPRPRTRSSTGTPPTGCACSPSAERPRRRRSTRPLDDGDSASSGWSA